jgi:hypothetical protein
LPTAGFTHFFSKKTHQALVQSRQILLRSKIEIMIASDEMAAQDNEYLRESAAETAALRATLESRVVDRNFCLDSTASETLNITCYGSSSSKTPQRYLEESRLLGYILSRRGHVCINGAGSFGCMAAMNDGVHAGEGHVRGVIHEMFLADNGYFDVDAKTQKRLMRRGSSHRVFENAIILNREEQKEQKQTPGKTKRASASGGEKIREILVAGTYLVYRRRERKRVKH